MAYPTFAVLDSSTEEVIDDLRFERATDGSGRGRAMFTASKKRFTVKHRLTSTDKDTLLAHYAANRGTVFTFAWPGDGANYNVVYERPPRLAWRGAEADIEVALGEV